MSNLDRLQMNRREFLFTSTALALAGCGGNNTSFLTDQFEGGSKYTYDYVPVLVLSGSWWQMGRQYGYLLANSIRSTYALVAPYKDFYNRGCGKMNAEIVDELFESYPQRFKNFFMGMAETSGLSLQQLKVANSLEIILIFGPKIYNNMRCSAVSTWGEYSRNGRLVYGRNYDYTKEFSLLNEHIAVTVFHPDDDAIPFAICTWAGCIYASTGINKKGIFLEENDCSSHDEEASGFFLTGDHYNMKTWVKDDVQLLSLLADVSSMAEADIWMKKNLPIYPHNIGVADKNEARCYQWNIAERAPAAPYVRQADGLMALTNHYFAIPAGWGLAPFREADGIGGIDRTIPGGSIPRLTNLLALSARFKGEIDVDKMCEIMDVKFEYGGATVSNTLYQIVCEPETFTFKLKTLRKPEAWVDIPLHSLFFPQ